MPDALIQLLHAGPLPGPDRTDVKQPVRQQHRRAKKLGSRPDQRLHAILVNYIKKAPARFPHPHITCLLFHSWNEPPFPLNTPPFAAQTLKHYKYPLNFITN